jgi:peptidyl-prolyl cis-trans isomerase C
MTTGKEFMKNRVVQAVFAVALTFGCQAFGADNPKVASSNKAASATMSAPGTDEVVARVNGTSIKRKELDTAVQALATQMARRGRAVPASQSATLEHDVLDELIGRELLLEEGSKHIPLDIEKKVQEQVDQTKTQLGGEDEFKKTLAGTGITPEEYAQRVRDNLIIHAAIDNLDKEFTISPAEVRDFYDKNPDQFKQPESVRASHILIRVPPDATDDVKKAKKAQIDAARSLVKGGQSFADVAKKVSEDPGSAPKGGDLGYFSHGQMVPEFDVVAFSLKTNQVSDVITTQFGYHILIVTGRKPAQTMAFDDVKDELGKYLKQRKANDATRDHVAELRKMAKIDVLLPEAPLSPLIATPPAK